MAGSTQTFHSIKKSAVWIGQHFICLSEIGSQILRLIAVDGTLRMFRVVG